MATLINQLEGHDGPTGKIGAEFSFESTQNVMGSITLMIEVYYYEYY